MRSADAEQGDSLDDAAAVFTAVRPRLFGIAYRMLGSAAEAEDVVQDVWLRWQGADRSAVENPTAFLTTATTRLAINVTQSARVRREGYVGPWLPEPVDTRSDPALGAERSEAVEIALLLLLERLTPTERAAYVLREAFDYPYREIAGVLDLSEPNARQLVSRARKHVAAGRRERVGTQEHRRLLEAFVAAARAGDMAGLEKLLATDVVNYGDGGGAVRNAAKIPVVGSTRVARFITAFAPRFWPDTEVAWVEANGQTAALVVHAGTPMALLAISASEQGIDQLMWVLNPEKLTGFSSLAAAASSAPPE
ncbi:RNA polymerase sigma-70 factor [Actinacidiphila sp. bgisy167]|uniref:RNA polymerase sigma-70 factor n=1 Tax=Actinacidiphila sp. bgisy167 TaxID=3413797 RepID=UPI003D74894E